MNWTAWYRPEFLWGMLFLGGVLLIHLLRRPRVRVLDFSTLRFFREQTVRATRVRRLRKLLLLLVRLLLVALLVALFAQPFDKRDRLSLLRDPHLTLFIWIDRTPSMEYSEKNVSRLRRACALMDTCVHHLPATANLLIYDEAQGDFVPYERLKPPTIRFRHGPPLLDRVLRAWDERRGDYSLPVLMLLSDFQKSTTESLDSLLRRKPPEAEVLCVTLTPSAPWNYSLRDALLADAGTAAQVSVMVEAQGRRLDSGEVAVSINGVRAGKKSVSLGKNDTSTVSIEAGSSLGAAGGKVTLATSDPLAFDNTAFFTAQNRGAMSVMVVGDRERNFPVAAAFSAAGPRRWNPVTVKTGDEVSYDELDSADVIVVNGLDKPSRALQALVASRSSGKKVILYALATDDEGFGPSVSTISRFNTSPKPLKLLKPSLPATIVLPDTISGIWRGFPSLRTKEAAIYRYAEGLPGTPLLRLDNGAPLITLLTDDQGRSWVLAATPLGVTDANNLCETGFYVPCIDRIAWHAAGGPSAAGDAWIAGFERRNPMYASGISATVLNEEGKFIDQWRRQPSVLFKQPGLFKIVPDGQAAYWVAVRPEPEESELSYPLPTIPEASKSKIVVVDERRFKEVLKGQGALPSYLPWLFLALLLLAETLLWERSRRVQ